MFLLRLSPIHDQVREGQDGAHRFCITTHNFLSVSGYESVLFSGSLAFCKKKQWQELKYFEYVNRVVLISKSCILGSVRNFGSVRGSAGFGGFGSAKILPNFC